MEFYVIWVRRFWLLDSKINSLVVLLVFSWTLGLKKLKYRFRISLFSLIWHDKNNNVDIVYFEHDRCTFSSSPLPSTGLQVILPGYLQSSFIQAALNYIGCKSEGHFVCQSSDCWCECSADFPQCNCPLSDLQYLESNLLRIRDNQRVTYQEFEESGESGVLNY